MITRPDQVEIFEPILGDSHGHVTTGLLNAIDYLKDNRILPTGFDKAKAEHDIRVVGGAESDPCFTGGSSRIQYEVPTGRATGPYKVEVEVWYQPVGYRWAHNLAPYHSDEPQRFVGYYTENAADSAVMLAHAETVY